MLALDLIAAHLIGDFLLQNGYLADHKLADWRVRLLHISLYSLPFVLVMIVHGVALERAALFLGLNFAIHFVIDSRRWVSGEDWAPRPIVFDQTLHIVTLAVLAHLL